MAETIPVPVPVVGTHGFNVVVLGSMNPRLHYPLWYHLIGCLTEEEANRARESPSFLIAPPFARFESDKFTITCTEDRWEILTGATENIDRVVEVAARVFEKLSETPVGAFGFNSMEDVGTKAASTAEILSKLVLGLNLGFFSTGEKGCQIVFQNKYDTHSVNITVRPSVLYRQNIWVSFNSHHSVTPQPGYFDLAEELRANVKAHRSAASGFVARLVESIDKIVGVGDGN